MTDAGIVRCLLSKSLRIAMQHQDLMVLYTNKISLTCRVRIPRRHRGKIESAIGNAKVALEVRDADCIDFILLSTALQHGTTDSPVSNALTVSCRAARSKRSAGASTRIFGPLDRGLEASRSSTKHGRPWQKLQAKTTLRKP